MPTGNTKTVISPLTFFRALIGCFKIQFQLTPPPRSENKIWMLHSTKVCKGMGECVSLTNSYKEGSCDQYFFLPGLLLNGYYNNGELSSST